MVWRLVGFSWLFDGASSRFGCCVCGFVGGSVDGSSGDFLFIYFYLMWFWFWFDGSMGVARICGGSSVLVGGMVVVAIVIVVADVNYYGCCVCFFIGSFGLWPV